MTEHPSRRTFVKGVAATGTAATGLAAFGAQGAAQAQGQQSVDIQNVQYDVTEGGDQASISLINVQVSGVSVNALNQNNVTVQVGDDVVDISDVTIIGDDLADIDIQDVNVALPVTISVAILGASGVQDQTEITQE